MPYDFQPSGITFNPPITLVWNYDPATLQAGVSETSLEVAFYDSVTSSWVVLPDAVVDITNHTITASVGHFTTFAVMAPQPTPTPTPAPTITPSPTPAPTPTPTEGDGGGIDWWVWLLIGLGAVVVLGIGWFWYSSRRTA